MAGPTSTCAPASAPALLHARFGTAVRGSAVRGDSSRPLLLAPAAAGAGVQAARRARLQPRWRTRRPLLRPHLRVVRAPSAACAACSSVRLRLLALTAACRLPQLVTSRCRCATSARLAGWQVRRRVRSHGCAVGAVLRRTTRALHALLHAGAVWTVSSCKSGHGVDSLRDDSNDTYWQCVLLSRRKPSALRRAVAVSA
jgi:hypothetical protein